MTVYGYDASHYDWDRRPLKLGEIRAAGISVMTHKATEGTTYTDPRLDDWAAQAKTAGFPVVGTYHVLWPGNVTDQVNHWFNTVNSKAPWWRDHPCFIWQIDCEIFQNMPRSPNRTEIEACGDLIVARTGCKPTQVVAYAPKWVYGNALAGLSYRLWSSNYVGSGAYKAVYTGHGGDSGTGWAPYSGQTPLIWQYSSTTTIGSQPECDANAIRVATEPALQALFTDTLGEEDMPLTAADVNLIWDEPITNTLVDNGLPEAARTRLLKAQAYANQAQANAAQAQASVSTLTAAVTQLAAKVTDLQDAVAQLQPGGPVGGPATVSLTGTLTPS